MQIHFIAMAEVWETADNLFHEKPGEPGIVCVEKYADMKWIQLPDSMGSERLDVLDREEMICSCKKHKTMVYYMERGIYCFHCQVEGGFVFCEKKK
jgi:hypothetical protein